MAGKEFQFWFSEPRNTGNFPHTSTTVFLNVAEIAFKFLRAKMSSSLHLGHFGKLCLGGPFTRSNCLGWCVIKCPSRQWKYFYGSKYIDLKLTGIGASEWTQLSSSCPMSRFLCKGKYRIVSWIFSSAQFMERNLPAVSYNRNSL